jgi:hypothetical protein
LVPLTEWAQNHRRRKPIATSYLLLAMADPGTHAAFFAAHFAAAITTTTTTHLDTSRETLMETAILISEGGWARGKRPESFPGDRAAVPGKKILFAASALDSWLELATITPTRRSVAAGSPLVK